MKSEKTDVVVIGAGPGGYVAAIRLAQSNKKVVLIELNKLGGVCLNQGCIPSKALIYTSELFNQIKNSEKFGIKTNDVTMDFQRMQEWKDSVISKLEEGIRSLCKGNNVKIILGKAEFVSSNEVKIHNEEKTINIEFDHAIIATGSKPIEIPNLKFDGQNIIDSGEALNLKEIPNNLVVVGGGYIGLELGTVYSKLGSNVRIVEMTNQILPGFDNTLITVLKKKIEASGIEIFTGTKAQKYLDGKLIAESNEKGKIELDADKVLVAIGRYPNTRGLGLENTKVSLNEKEFIKVDKNLRTDDKNIFAIGDISSGPMLAHKASYQGKHVAELISGTQSITSISNIPAVIFTDPEISTIGINEREAAKKGIDTITGKFPFLASSRAQTKGQIYGFVRLIANKDDHTVVGAEIIGENSSDLISEVALAIKMKSTLEDISDTVHPHPTLSESLLEAAEASLGKAIHILNAKK